MNAIFYLFKDLMSMVYASRRLFCSMEYRLFLLQQMERECFRIDIFYCLCKKILCKIYDVKNVAAVAS